MKQMPTSGAGTSIDQLDLLTKMDRGALTFRISSISVPTNPPDPPMESYYNADSTVLAVTGYDTKKRHFCYLLGGIPHSDVPDPSRHVVYEFHFNNLKENRMNEWEELPKSGFPSRVDGFALLGTIQREPAMKPTTVSLMSAEFPEQDRERTRFYGNDKGGVMISDKGDVEIITSDGGSIKFGESIDLGDKTFTGENPAADNMWIMQNKWHDGRGFGFPIPDVLPLSILTHDPTLNLPAIAQTYVTITAYKNLVTGIKKMIKKSEEISNLA